MKRIFYILAPCIFLLLYLVFLSQPVKTESATIPPLGDFLNPFTGFWQNAEQDDS